MRQYPSKIILFGEHTLLWGSEGLAIPGNQYFGHWAQGNPRHQGTDLYSFADYLSGQKFHNRVDHAGLLKDATNGWFFDSNIPVGYGVGSSGAYSAAIYDRYACVTDKDASHIRQDLAAIESFFHGSSSGIDPLISYYDRSFHLKDGYPEEVVIADRIRDSFTLTDTGIKRDGSDYIRLFAQKMEDPNFAQKIKELYIPLVTNAIDACLKDDIGRLHEHFFEISYFQLVWMTEFIPFHLIKKWEQQLSDYTGYYKICGAGGGGFLLKIRK
ncbi:MAG TPA: hypothetical protein PLC76_03905 [Saprospiraceae bacterium]|jgi:mevalonate kinase|nr:hypothetical protein [Saprospiraceae bacterium]HQP75775.1 hypothetical protein [Saprospiraceae bacterium]HRN33184.1 hypothetical protein [Saprospiraceae bacterium]HRP83843.1 hypothetical protein [Saprospiraceae bacterium]